MSDSTDVLEAYLNEQLNETVTTEVTPMVGGGSCEIFAIDRGASRWVLRRAPRHASSATAHDVMREFRILDAIKDTPVPIANPILACEDPAVFGSPFYVMERVDGVPIRPDSRRPGQTFRRLTAGAGAHRRPGGDPRRRLEACGLHDLAHTDAYLQRQIGRWLRQLDSYESRELPVARSLAEWMTGTVRRPSRRPSSTAITSSTTCFTPPRAPAPACRRRLGDGRHRRPARGPRLDADLPPRSGGDDAPRHLEGAGLPPGRAPRSGHTRGALCREIRPRHQCTPLV